MSRRWLLAVEISAIFASLESDASGVTLLF